MAVQNEEKGIAAAVECFTRHPGADSIFEVLVVDGGSSDGTASRAAAAGAPVLSAPKGRGRQMNDGALAARAPLLLFVHADARPTAAQLQALIAHAKQHACQPHWLWGCFESIAIDEDTWRMRSLCTAVRLRTKVLHLPFGDQGLLVSADLFREVRLMEDVDMVLRLHRAAGPPVVLPGPLQTSGRRWQQHGLIKVSALNLTMLVLFLCGVHPDNLAKLYFR